MKQVDRPPATFFGAINGFGNKKRGDREEADFYPTPPIAVYALLKSLDRVPTNVWEPACGQGHMVRELTRNGINVVGTDIAEYGTNSPFSFAGKMDFLSAQKPPTEEVNGIITNPPYKDRMAEYFTLKALGMPGIDFVAMLCRFQFVNGKRRYSSIFSKMPPTNVYIFDQRINCNSVSAWQANAYDQLGGMLEYAWYVWDLKKPMGCDTIMKWIQLGPLCSKWNLETFGSEQKNKIIPKKPARNLAELF